MSTKTKDLLLLDYRKSNKTRRARIIAKAGFATEADYIAYLMGPDPVPDTDQKPIIHNIHIVDISGSMSGAKIQAAMQGVNEEIDELKKDSRVEYTHSLVEFSEPFHIKTVSWKVPINSAPLYRTSVRGSTALNQAVGETLTRLVNEMKGDEKILIKIFTDGQENASNGYYANRNNLARFIKECEDRGFTITFIGTQSDIDYVVNNLNVDASNTFAHANTGQTMYLASATRSAATMDYATKVLQKKDVRKGFYKDIKQK